MPITTASYIANFDLDYPSDDSPSSTASLSWSAMQEVKRPVINSFPKLSSQMSASAAELHSLRGMGSTVLAHLATVSASLTLNKLPIDATAVATIRWNGSAKYVQSDTPTTQLNGDLWFQT